MAHNSTRNFAVFFHQLDKWGIQPNGHFALVDRQSQPTQQRVAQC